MSIKVMIEVWEHAPFTGTELLALVALADNANDDRKCWPGLKHIARKTRITIRQSINVLQDIALQGVITITPRKGGKRENMSNMYYIKPMHEWDLLNEYIKDNPSETGFTTLVNHVSLPYVGAKGGNVIEPSLEPKGKPKSVPRTPSTPLPEGHPLIGMWAKVRKIDAVNIGAPIYTTKDLATARRMAKWDSPPTIEEITNAITASKSIAYPFQWLESDIPKYRLLKVPTPSSTPSTNAADNKAKLAHDYEEMFGAKR